MKTINLYRTPTTIHRSIVTVVGATIFFHVTSRTIESSKCTTKTNCKTRMYFRRFEVKEFHYSEYIPAKTCYLDRGRRLMQDHDTFFLCICSAGCVYSVSLTPRLSFPDVRLCYMQVGFLQVSACSWHWKRSASKKIGWRVSSANATVGLIRRIILCLIALCLLTKWCVFWCTLIGHAVEKIWIFRIVDVR